MLQNSAGMALLPDDTLDLLGELLPQNHFR